MQGRQKGRRLARITSVQASTSRPELIVLWENGERTKVNLVAWLASGGDAIAPLRDPEIFRDAQVGHYGTSVVWGDPDGDLAIDAVHLRKIAAEQASSGAAELSAQQT